MDRSPGPQSASRLRSREFEAGEPRPKLGAAGDLCRHGRRLGPEVWCLLGFACRVALCGLPLVFGNTLSVWVGEGGGVVAGVSVLSLRLGHRILCRASLSVTTSNPLGCAGHVGTIGQAELLLVAMWDRCRFVGCLFSRQAREIVSPSAAPNTLGSVIACYLLLLWIEASIPKGTAVSILLKRSMYNPTS